MKLIHKDRFAEIYEPKYMVVTNELEKEKKIKQEDTYNYEREM